AVNANAIAGLVPKQDRDWIEADFLGRFSEALLQRSAELALERQFQLARAERAGDRHPSPALLFGKAAQKLRVEVHPEARAGAVFAHRIMMLEVVIEA